MFNILSLTCVNHKVTPSSTCNPQQSLHLVIALVILLEFQFAILIFQKKLSLLKDHARRQHHMAFMSSLLCPLEACSIATKCQNQAGGGHGHWGLWVTSSGVRVVFTALCVLIEALVATVFLDVGSLLINSPFLLLLHLRARWLSFCLVLTFAARRIYYAWRSRGVGRCSRLGKENRGCRFLNNNEFGKTYWNKS